MKALIFGGASIEEYAFCEKYINNFDIAICCDGGMHHARALNITPNYILGDFDSVNDEDFLFFKNKNIPIYEFPTKKDYTDMQLGINLAAEKGADELIIFGGIGSRFDHTLANAHLLLGLLKKGIKARLVNENNVVELISQNTIIKGDIGDLVSLIPLSMIVEKVTLKGFMYPLNNYDLKIDDEIIGVSNVLTSENAEIQLEKGYLFVIFSKDWFLIIFFEENFKYLFIFLAKVRLFC